MTKERLIEKKIYLERRKAQKRNKRESAAKGVFPRMNIFVFTSLIIFLKKKGFISKEYINKSIIVQDIFHLKTTVMTALLFLKSCYLPIC
jgi:hypothetical protein